MEGVESIIDLDVGGTRFRTSRQTLLSDPNCMLAKMFDPESSFTVRSCMDCSLDPEPHPRRPHTPGPLHRGLGVQASPQDRNWYRGHSNFIAKKQKQK